jgi:hypothetical protein
MEVKHGLMWLLTLWTSKNTWFITLKRVLLEGIAYAVFEGHATNDYTPYTYKTTDFGKTWKSIITP